MEGYTNKHLRYLYRLLSPKTILWSEMIKSKELLDLSYDKQVSWLSRGKELEEFNDGKCVIQLGDDDPKRLAQAIGIIRPFEYNQIDLNCGCPSVKNDAHFGSNLMVDGGDHILYLVDAMNEACQGSIPISIKCRIGVHESINSITEDKYDTLYKFVSRIASSGSCSKLVIHARSAILQGVSPTKNRNIPPLKHEFVHQISRDFPDLEITLNGGIRSTKDIEDILLHDNTNIRGIMCGRLLLEDPLVLADIDELLFNTGSKNSAQSMTQIKIDRIQKYMHYANHELHIPKNKDSNSLILLPLAMIVNSLMIKTNLSEKEHEDYIYPNDRLNDFSEDDQLSRFMVEELSSLLTVYFDQNTSDIQKNLNDGYNPLKRLLKKLSIIIGKKIIKKMKDNCLK